MNSIYYPDPNIPQQIFLPEIKTNAAQKSENTRYQIVALTITVIILGVGAFYCPKCSCIGVNAIVTLGCGMGLVAIGGLAINIIIFLKGYQLDKRRRYLERSHYFSIDRILEYFRDNDKKELIHGIAKASPFGIREFVAGIKNKQIPPKVLEHLKTYPGLDLQQKYPDLFKGNVPLVVTLGGAL